MVEVLLRLFRPVANDQARNIFRDISFDIPIIILQVESTQSIHK